MMNNNKSKPILKIDGEDIFLSSKIDDNNKLSLSLETEFGEKYTDITDDIQPTILNKEIVFLHKDLPYDLYELLEGKGLFKITGIYIPNKPLLVTVNKEIVKEYTPDNYRDCFNEEFEQDEKLER